MKVKKYFNSSFLRALRRREGKGLQECADACGVHLNTYWGWEQGKCPHRDNLIALGDLFEVDFTLFLSRTDQVAWDNVTLDVMTKAVEDDPDPFALRTAIALNAVPTDAMSAVEPSEAEEQGRGWLAES